MLDEIEADHVAVVLTKDLSRLGRNSTMTGILKKPERQKAHLWLLEMCFLESP